MATVINDWSELTSYTIYDGQIEKLCPVIKTTIVFRTFRILFGHEHKKLEQNINCLKLKFYSFYSVDCHLR